MDGLGYLALIAIIFYFVLALLFIVGAGLIICSIVRYRKKIKGAAVHLGVGCTLISVPLFFCLSVFLSDLSSHIQHEQMDIRCLYRVAENNDYERVKELLESGVHPDSSGYMNGKNELYFSGTQISWTPLFFAIKNDNYEIAELLLQYGADPNLRFVHDIHTPIQSAIDYKRYDILQLIIDYGGNPNAHVSEDRDHPYLILAIENHDAVSAEILLRNGADPNAVNLNGYSALHLSEEGAKIRHYTEEERQASAEIAKLLKQYGATK